MFFKKKREDEFNFDNSLGPAEPLHEEENKQDLESIFKPNEESEQKFSNFNSSSMNSLPNSLGETKSSFKQTETSNNNIDSKDIQLVNLKLDAIKSELDALRQHILKIEGMIDEKKKRPMW